MAKLDKVLVTGANGYIAKHIVSQLLQAGYDVVGSVRSPKGARDIIDAIKPTMSDPNNIYRRLKFVQLDLNRDAGWDLAMKGIDVLIHTASPNPLVQPNTEHDLVSTALGGTLRVLKAANGAGIRRVIITSSAAAILYKKLEAGRNTLDENDWTDICDPRANAYTKSKTLAEQAAWEYVLKKAPHIALTTINPVFVLGPPLGGKFGTSIKVVQRLLRATDPMLPNLGFIAVDVRDIANMHVKVLDCPEAVGQRIIGGDQFFRLIDMAKILKDQYPDRRIVTRKAPDFAVRLIGLFNKTIGETVPHLGCRQLCISSDRARRMLGINFCDARMSLKSSAEYLIINGLV